MLYKLYYLAENYMLQKRRNLLMESDGDDEYQVMQDLEGDNDKDKEEQIGETFCEKLKTSIMYGNIVQHHVDLAETLIQSQKWEDVDILADENILRNKSNSKNDTAMPDKVMESLVEDLNNDILLMLDGFKSGRGELKDRIVDVITNMCKSSKILANSEPQLYEQLVTKDVNLYLKSITEVTTNRRKRAHLDESDGSGNDDSESDGNKSESYIDEDDFDESSDN